MEHGDKDVPVTCVKSEQCNFRRKMINPLSFYEAVRRYTQSAVRYELSEILCSPLQLPDNVLITASLTVQVSLTNVKIRCVIRVHIKKCCTCTCSKNALGAREENSGLFGL